jgi:hypothetical protein
MTVVGFVLCNIQHLVIYRFTFIYCSIIKRRHILAYLGFYQKETVNISSVFRSENSTTALPLISISFKIV